MFERKERRKEGRKEGRKKGMKGRGEEESVNSLDDRR